MESPVPRSHPRSLADPETFVRAHQAMVWRYLRLLGAQPADAEDLTQETFLRFLARHDLEAVGLLRTIARGLWIDQQRWFQRRRAHTHADLADQLVAETEASALDDRWLHALRACRATLTDRARAALDLFYRDQRSRTDVAESLGMTAHGARNLLARTRQTLKSCIERRVAAEVSR